RTGRYKPVILFALAVMAVGVALMTQITADTDFLVFFSWMFITGVGIGPTLAVFTIVVQNSVAFHELGTATSDLTLFRQIGSTIGISLAFTLFRINLTWDLLRDQFAAAGIPTSFLPSAPPAGFDPGQLTSVGGGGNPLAFLQQVPAQVQPLFVNGFHSAFSIAIGNSVWLGVVAAVVAGVAALALHEIPLRRTVSPGAQQMAQHVASREVAD
ncbi:MAG TPA: hypothetical protein VFP19_07605, partial [Candidatus Limnocylindrales bacterium]|nr:hypothetical protein [Candidatus Limnocylindrales bacterium]